MFKTKTVLDAEKQVLIPEYMSVSEVMPEFENAGSNENEAEIIVSKKRTYEAAHGYVGEDFTHLTGLRRIQFIMTTASIHPMWLYSNPIQPI